MPAAIALIVAEVAAEAFAFASEIGLSLTLAATVANLAAYATEIGLSLAVSLGAEALFAPKLPEPEAGKSTFRQSRPASQRGYGQCRLSGPTALYEAYQSTLFQIVAVHDGKITSFDHWFLNDDEVAIANPVGFQGGEVLQYPDGRYPTNHVGIFWRYGLDSETLYPGPNGVIPSQWPATSTGDGVASFLLSCTNGNLNDFQKQFPNNVPNPSTVASLAAVWDWRDPAQHESDPDTWAFSKNPILCFRDYVCRILGNSHARRIAPLIDMWTEAARVCDEDVQVLNWGTYLTIGSVGTSSPALGPSVAYMVIPHDAAAATITVGTVIFTGSEQLTVQSVGVDTFGWRITFTRKITYTYLKGSWITWQKPSGAFQKRYEIGGFYKSDTDPADVIRQLLQSCDGWFSSDGEGHFVIYAGKYYAPAYTIPPEAIVGYELKRYQEDENATNSLLVSFCDPAHQWTMTDTDPWDDEADIEARGAARTRDMKLPWVQANSQARRLAKRAMTRLVAAQGSITLNLAGVMFLGLRYLAFSVGDVPSLNAAIVEVKKVEIDLSNLRVTYQWVMADPHIDNWNPLAEELAGPGVGNRFLSQPLPPSVIESVTPSYPASTGNSFGTQLTIVATSPLGADVVWRVQIAPHGTTDWMQSNFDNVPDGSPVTLTTGLVQAGELDVQVAYRTPSGMSDWSAIYTVTASPPSTTQVQAEALVDLVPGDFVHVFGPSGQMALLADAGYASLFANGFVLDSIANGQTGTVYLTGVNSAVTILTSLAQVWLSDTSPGGFLTTAPASPGSLVQALGPAVAGVGITFIPGPAPFSPGTGQLDFSQPGNPFIVVI